MITASRLDLPKIGPVFVAENGSALCYIGFGPKAKSGLNNWVLSHLPGSAVRINSSPLLAEVGHQLQDYLLDKRRSFDLPLAFHGTSFQLRTWEHMTRIPFGQTVTYGELASKLGISGAMRAVGQACGANPIPIVVPCHRVLAKSGLGGFSGGLTYKRILLAHEGILR